MADCSREGGSCDSSYDWVTGCHSDCSREGGSCDASYDWICGCDGKDCDCDGYKKPCRDCSDCGDCDCHSTKYRFDCTLCDNSCYEEARTCTCNAGCYSEGTSCTCDTTCYSYTKCKTCDGCDSYVPCSCNSTCYQEGCSQCHSSEYYKAW